MDCIDYINLENEYAAHNYKPLDVVLSHVQGVWVWDVDGKKYLDCLSAYSAVNQGHCHPKIVKTMVEQVRKLTLIKKILTWRHNSVFSVNNEVRIMRLTPEASKMSPSKPRTIPALRAHLYCSPMV